MVYFSSLHNSMMFKDICKWDLLPLRALEALGFWMLFRGIWGFWALFEAFWYKTGWKRKPIVDQNLDESATDNRTALPQHLAMGQGNIFDVSFDRPHRRLPNKSDQRGGRGGMPGMVTIVVKFRRRRVTCPRRVGQKCPESTFRG